MKEKTFQSEARDKTAMMIQEIRIMDILKSCKSRFIGWVLNHDLQDTLDYRDWNSHLKISSQHMYNTCVNI